MGGWGGGAYPIIRKTRQGLLQTFKGRELFKERTFNLCDKYRQWRPIFKILTKLFSFPQRKRWRHCNALVDTVGRGSVGQCLPGGKHQSSSPTHLLLKVRRVSASRVALAFFCLHHSLKSQLRKDCVRGKGGNTEKSKEKPRKAKKRGKCEGI